MIETSNLILLLSITALIDKGLGGRSPECEIDSNNHAVVPEEFAKNCSQATCDFVRYGRPNEAIHMWVSQNEYCTVCEYTTLYDKRSKIIYEGCTLMLSYYIGLKKMHILDCRKIMSIKYFIDILHS